MEFKQLIIAKPGEFNKLDEKSLEEVIKADQRVYPLLDSFIEIGTRQITQIPGYTNNNLPDKSPKYTPDIVFDDISFKVMTYVSKKNPKYQEASDNIMAFLQCLINDWKRGIRKDRVKQFWSEIIIDGKTKKEKLPFGRWDYLMENILWYIAQKTELTVTNELTEINPPENLEKMELNVLVIPEDLQKNPNIQNKGAARIWYLAKRFRDEVQAETTQPYKQEMIERSGVTEELIKPKEVELERGKLEIKDTSEKAKAYLEQVGHYLSGLIPISSPRRQPGKALPRLYKIPEKYKPKGSTDIPIVIDDTNYKEFLEVYRPILDTSLKKWKQLDGNIGELVTFYYGIQDHPQVKEEYLFLPQYQIKLVKSHMWINIPVLLARMQGLEKNYTKDRYLNKLTIQPLV